MDALSELIQAARTAIAGAGDLAALDRERVHYLGKKGALTERLKELGRLPPERRREAGQAINEAKQALETALAARKTALEAAVLSMPDQMEEIYQMIVAAPRSHELGVKLSEAVGNLRLREEIEGEVADDLQSSIPGIVVPLHQNNARRAAAQTAA